MIENFSCNYTAYYRSLSAERAVSFDGIQMELLHWMCVNPQVVKLSVYASFLFHSLYLFLSKQRTMYSLWLYNSVNLTLYHGEIFCLLDSNLDYHFFASLMVPY